MQRRTHPLPRSLSRRDLLAGSATLASLALMPGAFAGISDTSQSSQSTPPAQAAQFLTARRHGERYEAVLLDAQGHDVASAGLPERGHSFAIDAANGRAVVFGRQPGFYAQVMDLPSCAASAKLPLPADRHYFGHGVFSHDAGLLFATENDFDAGHGVIGVYDARPGASWQRLGEFLTDGIGPHEVVLMPDGRTLCVANGGLLTHPDFGKTPLNVATMKPSLVYLDAKDGRLLDKIELAPALFQLSIRHLAVSADGAVWFACQHEGPAAELPPLLGRHRRGSAVELFAGPDDVLHGLRNYLGSISIDVARGVIATSSPVGGHVAFWNSADGASLGSTARPDACGIAARDDGRFVISDGLGAIIAATAGSDASPLLQASPEIAWDNHLRRL